jgi:hypothetical protein
MSRLLNDWDVTWTHTFSHTGAHPKKERPKIQELFEVFENKLIG